MVIAEELRILQKGEFALRKGDVMSCGRGLSSGSMKADREGGDLCARCKMQDEGANYATRSQRSIYS